jgi:ABC-type phosphonate transport system ATPase subunit
LAQLWVNPATRDWTVVYVDPVSGIACMVAAGTEFGIDRAAPGQRRSGAI